MVIYNRSLGINWELKLDKFLTKEEVKKLRKFVKNNRDKNKNKRLPWFEWFINELGLNTGLRVFEMINLTCGDIVIRSELSYVFVRDGKCGKSRQVRINKEFCSSVQEYLNWKQRNNEGVNPNDVLILSPKTKSRYSTRGLQKAFKRCLVKAGIPDYHSIHHLRHTFASLLLVASNNNMPLVQKQLGHSSIQTTQVYTNLFKQEIQQAIERLF